MIAITLLLLTYNMAMDTEELKGFKIPKVFKRIRDDLDPSTPLEISYLPLPYEQDLRKPLSYEQRRQLELGLSQRERLLREQRLREELKLKRLQRELRQPYKKSTFSDSFSEEPYSSHPYSISSEIKIYKLFQFTEIIKF